MNQRTIFEGIKSLINEEPIYWFACDQYYKGHMVLLLHFLDKFNSLEAVETCLMTYKEELRKIPCPVVCPTQRWAFENGIGYLREYEQQLLELLLQNKPNCNEIETIKTYFKNKKEELDTVITNLM